MMNGLNGALHGALHVMIGGAWSDEVYDNSELIDLFRSTERILYFKDPVSQASLDVNSL